MDKEFIKRIIEVLIFISESALSVDKIKDVLEKEADEGLIKELVEELKAEYVKEGRPFNVTEVAGGFQMVTDPKYASWIKKFKAKTPPKLSRASLETLAIIAYRQPVTRADIEFVRGVNAEGVTATLLEKGLIRVVGRKEGPGRPYCYGTNKFFLEHFSMKSLEELPGLKEFTEKDVELPSDRHQMVEMQEEGTELQEVKAVGEEELKVEEAENEPGEVAQENR